jgi:Fe2+ or Zn2+ uptake regulation protein
LAENEKSRYLEQRETILRYLEAAPHAADTVEGVVIWWLPRQRYRDAYQDIEKILEELTAEGLVVKTRLLDNKVIYSCKPR